MYRLIGMPLSPATNRATWALDYAEVPYQFEEYLPQITTLWVRMRTRRIFGQVSVPILLGPNGVKWLDSWDIALQVHQDCPMAGLIPAILQDQIKRMNELSEAIFYAARILLVGRVLADQEAMLEAVPAGFPQWSRRPMLPLVRQTFIKLRKKYDEPGVTDQDHLDKLHGYMQRIREQLDCKPYLLEQGFSYADMTIISALQLIKPVRHAPGVAYTAYERACICPQLAEDYTDVMQWRDRVYGQHRHKSYLGNPVTS
jgi:glutathione S-transferase